MVIVGKSFCFAKSVVDTFIRKMLKPSKSIIREAFRVLNDPKIDVLWLKVEDLDNICRIYVCSVNELLDDILSGTQVPYLYTNWCPIEVV